MSLDSNKPKRIQLLGTGRLEEVLAGDAITPGHLLATNSDGEAIPHNSAGGYAETRFAAEDALQGKSIDDDYAAGDRVTVIQAQPGDVIYAWLDAGENVTPADFLTSNGDGTLKEATSTNVRLAVPLESLDLSDSDAVPTRIRVRVL